MEHLSSTQDSHHDSHKISSKKQRGMLSAERTQRLRPNAYPAYALRHNNENAAIRDGTKLMLPVSYYRCSHV